MSRGITPEQIENLSAALRLGLNAAAARMGTQASRREAALANLAAVAPDPAMLEALTTLAAKVSRPSTIWQLAEAPDVHALAAAAPYLPVSVLRDTVTSCGGDIG